MTHKIVLPLSIRRALAAGAAIYLSTSGGKDSQATAYLVMAYIIRNGLSNPIYIIHSDLGRAEWSQSPAMNRKIARHIGLPLIVVRREAGDLLDRMDQRAATLTGEDKVPWPSSKERYCTSDLKRGPIDVALRATKPSAVPWPDASNRYCTSNMKLNPINKAQRSHPLVISVTGIRAQESIRRGRNTPLKYRKYATVRTGITSSIAGLKKVELPNVAFDQWLQMCRDTAEGKDLPRLALNWNPLMNTSIDDVYKICGHSLADLHSRRRLYEDGQVVKSLDGWNMHPAYVFGNERLSCAICILASAGDIRNGARHNPDLARWYLQREVDWGYTFKNKQSLADILEGLDLSDTQIIPAVPTTPMPVIPRIEVEHLTCAVPPPKPTQLTLFSG